MKNETISVIFNHVIKRSFRAMARALAARPEEMSRILNELYSLDGQAFRTKLEQMGRQYIKKHPQALMPTKLVVPEKLNRGNGMGQFQHSAGMLERTLYLQKAGNIPIKDVNFVKTAYLGLLQTAAYRNLAAMPEYADKMIDKNVLDAEIDRLKKDVKLDQLPQLIENGHGKALLDGIKKLSEDPVKMNQFLADACKDPEGAFRAVSAEHPGPAQSYVTIPTLPKTQVKNDALPPDGQYDFLSHGPLSG